VRQQTGCLAWVKSTIAIALENAQGVAEKSFQLEGRSRLLMIAAVEAMQGREKGKC
jgi:hypothetical protein